VYIVFCILIIIIIVVVVVVVVVTVSISVFFVVLLHCLYLNPQVSPFVHFSSPSCCGGKRGVSERLFSVWLLATGLNHNTQDAKKSKTCVISPYLWHYH